MPQGSDESYKITMAITLELSHEAEEQLRQSASRQDAGAIRRLLNEAVASTVEALLRETPDELIDAEFETIADRLADEFASCFPSKELSLSNYAVSREGIYEDHP